MRSRTATILDAMVDPQMFARWFDAPSWAAWRVFLTALFALTMPAADLPLFQRCTRRERPPSAPAKEAWVVVGRRGGKSLIAALLAVWCAVFRRYPNLKPGESAVVMVIATNKDQAKVILGYVSALLRYVEALAPLIDSEDSDSITLTNGIAIEVHAASFRSIRGRTVVAAIFDEVAYWRDDSRANPDKEILNAIRPAMATVPDAILIGISSPYMRRGILFEQHDRHFGQDGSTLVWQAPTDVMNPAIDRAIIDDAIADDPLAAAAEYGAEFRTDISGFLDLDLIRDAKRLSPREMPYLPGVTYSGFVDPSGGRSDAFTLGIAHLDGERAVLDVIRATRPPFDPASVVAGYAEVLRSYGVQTVTGDRYAGAWVSAAFASHGIAYEVSSLSKSEIYLEALPLFTRGAAEVPDDAKLITELARLERRTARGGRDSVDHPPGAHDDLANAACGALVLAASNVGTSMDLSGITVLTRPCPWGSFTEGNA